MWNYLVNAISNKVSNQNGGLSSCTCYLSKMQLASLTKHNENVLKIERARHFRAQSTYD